MNTKFENSFVNRLVTEYGYPFDMIRTDVIFSKGKSRYSTDYVVYNQGKPYMIIEQKNYRFNPEDIDRLRTEMEISGARYGIFTNPRGSKVYFYGLDQTYPDGTLKEVATLPKFGEKGYSSSERRDLIVINELEIALATVLWKLVDIRRGKSLGSELELLTDVAKILAAKVYDEEKPDKKSSFWASPEDDDETIKLNIESLLLNLREKLSISPKLRISGEEVKTLVLSIQNYDLIKSGIRQKGLSVIPSDFLRDPHMGIFGHDPKVEFLIGNFLMKLVDVQKNDRLLDPACGIGNFLACAEKTQEVHGFERNTTLVELAKINLYLVGITNAIIHNEDTLNTNIEEKFDIILTNPPYGRSSTSDSIREYVRNYRLPWFGKASTEYEILILEQSLNLLESNGKIAIILPNKVLSGISFLKVREFIAKKYKINAVINISARMIPKFNWQMSMLLISKQEIVDYSDQVVFFANIEDQGSFEKALSEIAETYKKYSLTKDENLVAANNAIVCKLSDDYRLDYSFYKRLIGSVIDFDKYKVETLGQLADIQMGAKIDEIQSKGISDHNEAYVIRGQNIRDYFVEPNYDNKVKLDLELNYKYMINPQDITMTRAGTPNNIGIFLLNHTKCIASENIIILRAKRDKVDPYYLLCYLISKNGQEDLEARIRGKTIRFISIQNLLNLRIPLPTLDIQSKIANEFMKYLTLKENKRKVEDELIKTKETIDTHIGSFYKKGGSK